MVFDTCFPLGYTRPMYAGAHGVRDARCLRACARACVHACLRACMCADTSSFFFSFEPFTSPRPAVQSQHSTPIGCGLLFRFRFLFPLLVVTPPATAASFLFLSMLFMSDLYFYACSRSGESVESSPQTNGLHAPPHGAGGGPHEQARSNTKPDGTWPTGEELQLQRNRPAYEDQVKNMQTCTALRIPLDWILKERALSSLRDAAAVRGLLADRVCSSFVAVAVVVAAAAAGVSVDSLRQ